MTQASMPLTEETIQQLPPFVAAFLQDARTGDEEQQWCLRDLNFDPETLDDLPLREGTTCEIWVNGWVRRGPFGNLSLSPHLICSLGEPQSEVFAWVMERDLSPPEHITLWRMCKKQNDEHPPLLSAENPLEEVQLVNLAREILEIHAHRNLHDFLAEVWGHIEQIDAISFQSAQTMGSEEISRINVWNRGGALLPPDFGLPYWVEQLEQESGTAAVLLSQDLDECQTDEARLEVINEFLYRQGVFKEKGLPDPRDESPFFRGKVELRSVPMEFPLVRLA